MKISEIVTRSDVRFAARAGIVFGVCRFLNRVLENYSSVQEQAEWDAYIRDINAKGQEKSSGTDQGSQGPNETQATGRTADQASDSAGGVAEDRDGSAAESAGGAAGDSAG